jgi:hypothetical protein
MPQNAPSAYASGAAAYGNVGIVVADHRDDVGIAVYHALNNAGVRIQQLSVTDRVAQGVIRIIVGEKGSG